MVGSRLKRKGEGFYSYYICQTKHRRAAECDSKRLAVPSIEGAVLDHLFANVLTVDGLQMLVSEWQASSRVSEHQVEKQVIVLKARLEQVKRTIGRLLDVYEQSNQPLEGIRTRLSDRERERVSIESELEQLRSNSPSSTLVRFSDVQLQQIADNWKADLLKGDRPKAKRVLQVLIAKVEAEKEGGKVYYTLPLLEKTSIDNVPPRGLEPRFWP